MTKHTTCCDTLPNGCRQGRDCPVRNGVAEPAAAPSVDRNSVLEEVCRRLEDVMDDCKDRFSSKSSEYGAGLCVDAVQSLKSAAPQVDAVQAVPEGSWLWGKLMDWCKKRGVAPANYDDLFAIAGEAHTLASPSPAVPPRPTVPEGFALVPTDPATCLAMGFAYLGAAREAEPCFRWHFSHAGYRAMLAVAKLAQPTDTTAGE